jgi:hypothetical protein
MPMIQAGNRQLPGSFEGGRTMTSGDLIRADFATTREWPPQANLIETPPREWPSRARFNETTSWTPSQPI